MEQELRILYLTLLQREPSFLETSNYLDNLINGILSIEDIQRDIENTLEYKRTLDDYYGDISYDRSMNILELTNLNDKKYDGVNIANGKLCVKTGAKPYETTESIISVKYDFDHLGRYHNNVIQGFKYTDMRFFKYEQENLEVTEYTQKLNMYNATFTKSYKLKNHETVQEIYVEHESLALQQYPYCFLQNIKIENKDSVAIDLPVYHMLSHKDNLTEVEYYNNTKDGVHMFSGNGVDNERKITVYTNSVYKFDSNVEIKGMSLGETESMNQFSVNIAGNSVVELSIITGMMSTSDFVEPGRELVRILLNIYEKPLKIDHNKKWIDVWRTADIVIHQKTNIESNEIEEATKSTEKFQRHIKYALYNIFSIVRDDVNVEVNPLNLSVIDNDGEIYWNSELFLVPVLLLLRPKCARVLLDYRYKQLENAKNLALAYGNKGSYYPYRGDVVYYKDVYWDSGAPVYAFNNALIALNVWNYYRVTQDKYWLHEKGFSIIQNCVRFFQSLFDEDYNLQSVNTINNRVEENNIFTRYLIITVIKHYREACYEISFNVPPDIEELYQNVKTNVVSLLDTVTVDVTVEIPQRVDIRTENGDISFYDTNTGDFIGKQFGGYSGYFIKVSNTVDYEFNIDTNTYVKLYDGENNEITEFEGTALYSSEYGLTDGSVIIKEGNITSYSNIYMKDYVFGKNAFVITSEKRLHNILDSNLENNILETHLVLMTYYSKLFFNNFNYMNKIDIIQDNLMYYNINNTNSDNFINKFIKSNLECLLAQETGLTFHKEYYITKFERTMENIFDSKEMSKPFGNHSYYSFMVFNILTSMVKLRIRGSISDQRFYAEIFGVDASSGNILPKYWGKLVVNYNNNVVTIANKN